MKVTIRSNGVYSAKCANNLGTAVAKAVKKRRIMIATAVMLELQETQVKRDYKKKQYWVAPYLKDRQEHSFFHISIPKLTFEDSIHFHNYVFSATQLEELLTLVGPQLQKMNVIRECIGPKERLALTLRCDSMTSMLYQYLVRVNTTSNIIRETCKAIWDTLQPLVLPSALTETECLDVAQNFDDVTNFAHCIGAIDGKHVTIQCPNNTGSTYYNYKQSHSIVILGICDANYIFRFVDIGAYGRRSDGGIFGDSIIGSNFDCQRMNVPKPAAVEDGRILPFCLMRDKTFPLKSYLLRSYPRIGLTLMDDIFNYRLSCARRIIENTFGILASQWRVFRKPIIAQPETAKLIVQAMECLHNWLRKEDIGKNVYVPPNMIDEESEDLNSFQSGTWRIMKDGCAFQDITNYGTNTNARNCMKIRDEFRDYFCNEGSVPWQYNRHK
ncbi:Putative nuclease HARBI1 [Trachymyrmex zeteki]|uniref:Putative nuclease HARBI1 n=1 Tax=Mycetomoellerius zeteki TaxID=64791 RepID=A0A151XHI6_9HYME|nr:Putative nuclease HARBI1 [Trachymyrmex zeteki]